MESLQPRHILVPTDLSDPAGHALRYAASLAARFDARLLILHAAGFDPAITFAEVAGGVYPLSGGDHADRAREALLQHAEENAPNILYDLSVVTTPPVTAILDAAAESKSDLIVMGTHGRTGLRRLLLGSITEEIIRTATVPVIAVREGSTEQGHVRNLVGLLSYTGEFREALIRAAALQTGKDSPIVLLRALDKQDDQETKLEWIRLRGWLPAELLARVELRVVPRDSEEKEILTIAELGHADMIALGVAVSRGLGETFHGTLAERLIQHSRCPILTVSERMLIDAKKPQPSEPLAGQA